MSRRIIFSMIGAGAMLIGSASEASAFELFGRALGGGCCPEPACGCAVEPSCGCAPSCDTGCCGHRHRGLFHGLFHRDRGCCEQPTCGCAPEPVCGVAAAPVCGCPETACGCGGHHGCGRHHRGLFSGLFHRKRGCCEPQCGCAPEPVCGCPQVAPVCGCAG
jgi:hypothetical protein